MEGISHIGFDYCYYNAWYAFVIKHGLDVNMNEIALIDEILQRTREKKTMTLNRNELGSLMALLKLVDHDMFDTEMESGMMNEQLGKIMIRFMQKLMNRHDKYNLTVSATERYVITHALATVNSRNIGSYENALITKLIMELY